MSDRLTKTLGPRFAALAGSVRLGIRITFRVRGCESDSIREGEVVTITMRGVVAFDEGKQWSVKWRNVVAVGAPNDLSSDADSVRCSALVLLHARWLEEANEMDAIASDEPHNDTTLALECYERARTLRDCANALEREWAGMKENAKLSRGSGEEGAR